MMDKTLPIMFGAILAVMVAVSFVAFTTLIAQSAIGGAVGWGIVFLISIVAVAFIGILFVSVLWD